MFSHIYFSTAQWNNFSSSFSETVWSSYWRWWKIVELIILNNTLLIRKKCMLSMYSHPVSKSHCVFKYLLFCFNSSLSSFCVTSHSHCRRDTFSFASECNAIIFQRHLCWTFIIEAQTGGMFWDGMSNVSVFKFSADSHVHCCPLLHKMFLWSDFFGVFKTD